MFQNPTTVVHIGNVEWRELCAIFCMTRAARALEIACDSHRQKSYRLNRPLHVGRIFLEHKCVLSLVWIYFILMLNILDQFCRGKLVAGHLLVTFGSWQNPPLLAHLVRVTGSHLLFVSIFRES